MLFTDQGIFSEYIYNIYWNVIFLTEAMIPIQAWQQASPSSIFFCLYLALLTYTFVVAIFFGW